MHTSTVGGLSQTEQTAEQVTPATPPAPSVAITGTGVTALASASRNACAVMAFVSSRLSLRTGKGKPGMMILLFGEVARSWGNLRTVIGKSRFLCSRPSVESRLVGMPGFYYPDDGKDTNPQKKESELGPHH